MTARLTSWHGDKIADGMRRAAVDAVDETAREAAEDAAGARSGRAAQVEAEPAQVSGDRVTARWGVFGDEPHGDPFWELFVEVGTAYQPGDNAKRRAADRHYPRLADRIRSRRRG